MYTCRCAGFGGGSGETTASPISRWVEGGTTAEVDDDETKDAKSILWDMARPLDGKVTKLEFLKFNWDADAKTAFWHSSAHMMGEALEHLYGCRLTIGPPLKGGFYYDSYMGSDALKEDDCKYYYFEDE